MKPVTMWTIFGKMVIAALGFYLFGTFVTWDWWWIPHVPPVARFFFGGLFVLVMVAIIAHHEEVK